MSESESYSLEARKRGWRSSEVCGDEPASASDGRASAGLAVEALTMESMSQNWRTFMRMGNRPIVLSKKIEFSGRADESSRNAQDDLDGISMAQPT